MPDSCSTRIICNKAVCVSAQDPCDALILLPMDGQELKDAPGLFEKVRGLCPKDSLGFAAFQVDWNRELAPWNAPAVFKGQGDFEGGAPNTLAFLETQLLPALTLSPKALLLGGYSLAGLFALWAGFETSAFSAIAAASPSVWFPGFSEYAAKRSFLAKSCALSLGDREAHTRHPLMRSVEEQLLSCHALLKRQGIPCAMEFNPGNHFQDADERLAKCIARALSLLPGKALCR